MGTESIYKGTTFLIGGLQTPNGSTILTSTGTFTLRAGGLNTAAGTQVMDASGNLNADVVTNYISSIGFTKITQATNVTSYCSPHGSIYKDSTQTIVNATGVAHYANIPFGGSVIGLGVSSLLPRTAGHVSFTAMNGTTALVTVTLNSTNTKRVNSSVQAAGTKLFTANNLRIRIKTGAAWAPTADQYFHGAVWVLV